jgi:hypothetical protein
LILFCLLILLLDFRFLKSLNFLPLHFDESHSHDFVTIASPLAVRLITVGVIILERHDVLEIAGKIPKGSARDEVSEKTHPFGIFFLVFGLLMECFVEQIELRTKLFDPELVTSIVVWVSYSVAVISFLAALKLLQILVTEWWRERSHGKTPVSHQPS